MRKPLKVEVPERKQPSRSDWCKDNRLMDAINGQIQDHIVHIEPIHGQIPSIIVTVPDKWPYIKLAPWYDVHLGNTAHQGGLFDRHLEWFAKEPYTLGWLGGDIMENANKMSIGSGVYHQDFNPQNQVVQSILTFAKVRHKLLFSIPGNHEDRSGLMGVDLSSWTAHMLGLEYSSDFMFVTLQWRGQKIRLLAHHGAGGASTAGAQRQSLRKLTQLATADLYWMGHLHSELVDKIITVNFNQKTHEPYLHEAIGIISPSYVGYFGTYAAKKIMSLTAQGLTVATIHEDGRIDASVHANGKRL